MQARYIPFWLYDVRAEGKCSFKNPRREDRRWMFLAESSAELEFRDVTQDATTELDDGLSQNLEPYDLDSARPFGYSWLSGLDARIYNMDDRQSYQTVRDRVIASLNRKLIPYDSSDIISRDIKSALISISAALICETMFLPLIFWYPPLMTVLRAEHDPGNSWQAAAFPFSGSAVLAGLLFSVIAAAFLRERTALMNKKDLARMTALIAAAAIPLMLLSIYLNFLINDTISAIFLTVLVLSLSAEFAIQFGSGAYRAAKRRHDNFPDLKGDADEFLLKDFSSRRLAAFEETEPYEEIFSKKFP